MSTAETGPATAVRRAAASPAADAVDAAEHERLQDAARDHLIQHFAAGAHVHREEARGDADAELLVLQRGEGPYVFDTRGRRHLDGLSCLFCSQLGSSYGEEMAAAMGGALTALPFNTTWGTAHPAAIDAAQALAERAPGDLDHVFFTNGGSESVEAMWKIAREHFRAIGQPARTKAIARDIAYHGVTLGALSFTGVPGYKDGFGTPPIDVTHVANTNAFRAPDGDDEAAFCARLLGELEDAVQAVGPDEVAVLIAEPVQNAGGCLTPPAGYWRGLRELCDRHGILLVADSVICGFGRLGTWLGIEQEGVVPDMVTTAKGITSAYAPGGAVFVRRPVIEALDAAGAPLRHGITFGGHPIVAAAALKNVEIFERDGVLENVRARSPHLGRRMEELRAIGIVGDVRGAGFFRAVELVRPGVDPRAPESRFAKAERDDLLRGFLPRRLRRAGLVARADDRGDSVLQVAPPLICDDAVLDELVDLLGAVLVDADAHVRRRG